MASNFKTCAECLYVITEDHYLVCSQCHDAYNINCTTISYMRFSFMEKPQRDAWLCKSCLKKQDNEGNNSETIPDTKTHDVSSRDEQVSNISILSRHVDNLTNTPSSMSVLNTAPSSTKVCEAATEEPEGTTSIMADDKSLNTSEKDLKKGDDSKTTYMTLLEHVSLLTLEEEPKTTETQDGCDKSVTMPSEHQIASTMECDLENINDKSPTPSLVPTCEKSADISANSDQSGKGRKNKKQAKRKGRSKRYNSKYYSSSKSTLDTSETTNEQKTEEDVEPKAVSVPIPKEEPNQEVDKTTVPEDEKNTCEMNPIPGDIPINNIECCVALVAHETSIISKNHDNSVSRESTNIIGEATRPIETVRTPCMVHIGGARKKILTNVTPKSSSKDNSIYNNRKNEGGSRRKKYREHTSPVSGPYTNMNTTNNFTHMGGDARIETSNKMSPISRPSARISPSNQSQNNNTERSTRRKKFRDLSPVPGPYTNSPSRDGDTRLTSTTHMSPSYRPAARITPNIEGRIRRKKNRDMSPCPGPYTTRHSSDNNGNIINQSAMDSLSIHDLTVSNPRNSPSREANENNFISKVKNITELPTISSNVKGDNRNKLTINTKWNPDPPAEITSWDSPVGEELERTTSPKNSLLHSDPWSENSSMISSSNLTTNNKTKSTGETSDPDHIASTCQIEASKYSPKRKSPEEAEKGGIKSSNPQPNLDMWAENIETKCAEIEKNCQVKSPTKFISNVDPSGERSPNLRNLSPNAHQTSEEMMSLKVKDNETETRANMLRMPDQATAKSPVKTENKKNAQDNSMRHSLPKPDSPEGRSPTKISTNKEGIQTKLSTDVTHLSRITDLFSGVNTESISQNDNDMSCRELSNTLPVPGTSATINTTNNNDYIYSIPSTSGVAQRKHKIQTNESQNFEVPLRILRTPCTSGVTQQHGARSKIFDDVNPVPGTSGTTRRLSINRFERGNRKKTINNILPLAGTFGWVPAGVETSNSEYGVCKNTINISSADPIQPKNNSTEKQFFKTHTPTIPDTACTENETVIKTIEGETSADTSDFPNIPRMGLSTYKTVEPNLEEIQISSEMPATLGASGETHNTLTTICGDAEIIIQSAPDSERMENTVIAPIKNCESPRKRKKGKKKMKGNQKSTNISSTTSLDTSPAIIASDTQTLENVPATTDTAVVAATATVITQGYFTPPIRTTDEVHHISLPSTSTSYEHNAQKRCTSDATTSSCKHTSNEQLVKKKTSNTSPLAGPSRSPPPCYLETRTGPGGRESTARCMPSGPSTSWMMPPTYESVINELRAHSKTNINAPPGLNNPSTSNDEDMSIRTIHNLTLIPGLSWMIIPMTYTSTKTERGVSMTTVHEVPAPPSLSQFVSQEPIETEDENDDRSPTPSEDCDCIAGCPGLSGKIHAGKDFKTSVHYLCAVFNELRLQFVAVRMKKVTIIKRYRVFKIGLDLVKKPNKHVDLEIFGIPEKKSENLTPVLDKLFRKISCQVEQSDILSYRRGGQIKKKRQKRKKPRSLIVKVASHKIREAIIATVLNYNRQNEGDRLNSSHLGFTGERYRIYIRLRMNESKLIIWKNGQFVWVTDSDIPDPNNRPER